MSADLERPVQFLIGGVQKGGTTALFDYMRQTLEVSLARVKEAHFFDDETIAWDAPDDATYHALFDPADPLPRGEATPIYLYWPRALERIAAYNPRMRLILIFRDPVERAWSHWRMEHQRGFDDAAFDWAVRAGRTRVTEDPDTPGFHRVYSYVERGFYGAQLAHALTLFPRSQILALKSEDLDRDPTAVLTQVARHIGVAAPKAAVAPFRSNVGAQTGGGLPDEDRTYLKALFSEDLKAFAQLSGLDIEAWEQ